MNRFHAAQELPINHQARTNPGVHLTPGRPDQFADALSAPPLAGMASLEVTLTRARNLMKQKAFGEAEPLLRDLELRGLRSSDVPFCLGLIAFSRNQEVTARSYFRKTLALAPNHQNAHFYLGALEKKAGQGAASQAHFEETLRLNPTHVGALREMRRTLAPVHVPLPPPPSGHQINGSPSPFTELMVPRSRQQVEEYEYWMVEKVKADNRIFWKTMPFVSKVFIPLWLLIAGAMIYGAASHL